MEAFPTVVSPTAQLTHAVDVAFLYVPFGQALHGPPAGPVNPGAHGCGGGVVVVGCGVVVVASGVVVVGGGVVVVVVVGC